MKTCARAALILLSLVFQLGITNGQPLQEQVVPAPSAYAATQKGPHSRVWESIVYEPRPVGRPFPRKHSYTEVATGLHHLVNGEWADSSDQIQSQLQGGAIAQNGQHQLYLPSDLYNDAIILTTPDSKTLISRPVGLAFADNERNVMIAELRQGPIGQILPGGNQILYTNICTDCSLDLLVTYKLAGSESDLIIRSQLPDPGAYGLTNGVRLQWWTEFFSPPEPQKTEYTLASGQRDQVIDFGAMKMHRGKAFLIGDSTELSPKVAVTKSWVTLQQRTFLVEEIPLKSVTQQLEALPPYSASVQPGSNWSKLFRLAKNLNLPAKRSITHTTNAVHIAKSDYRQSPGFVLDYEILHGWTNFTFKSDTTYYVTNYLNLYGSTIVEGGSVIKFGTNATAQVAVRDSISCRTAAYRPSVWTAKDDNSVGEPIPGSTGIPSGYYGSGLYLSCSNTLDFLRFLYCDTALRLETAQSFIQNAQFVHCSTAISDDDSVTVTIRNALGSHLDKFNAHGAGATLSIEHLTLDQCAYLNAGTDASLYLTNCLLTAVTNMSSVAYTLVSNSCAFLSANTGVFQTVGNASYYLAADSTNRNAGTTNINADLLTSLKQKTTYPPIVYSNTTISVDTTLSPQAQRDTDTPDLGYHYDPLDYVFGNTTADANLTFTPGTAVGWYPYPDGCGIHLNDAKVLAFNGTAEARDCWVRTTTVQERSNGAWDGGWVPGGITGSAWPDFGQSAQVFAAFTLFSILANDITHIRDDYGYLTVHAKDCEFWSGSLGGYASLLTFTNCLFDRPTLWTSWDGIPTTDCNLTLHNCLLRAGIFQPNRWASGESSPFYPFWDFRDTAFDNTLVDSYDDSGGDLSVTYLDYNGFLNGANQTFHQAGTHDVITNLTWKVGLLGYYYQTNTSPLINVGSTNADLLGLYHFTTTTNLLSSLQIKETNSIVDIGYHYVAVNTNGVPIDTDADGSPDYLEDANGNGAVNSGETDWNSATDLGLKVVITRPKNNSTIP